MLEAIFDLLLKEQISFDLGLHPNISDIRAVNWINQSEKYSNKLKIRVRYTGVIDFSHYSSPSDLLMSLRKSRRDEILKTDLIFQNLQMSKHSSNYIKPVSLKKGYTLARVRLMS